MVYCIHYSLTAIFLLFLIRPARPQKQNFDTICCELAKVEFNISNAKCNQAYQPQVDPAPSVKVPYWWCAQNCPGFEASTQLNQWLTPFVTFLIPGLVFSMSVPKARMLRVTDELFNSDSIAMTKLIWYAIKMISALFLSMFDAIIWVCCVFVYAGPMLIGGLHEAELDSKMLKELTRGEREMKEERLRRRELLLAIVAGNIDPDPNWSTVWEDTQRTIVDASPEDACRWLTAILESQTSFGGSVGAPVAFYVGAFFYSILQAEQNLGDNNTAHAIAFGLWWSVVVTISIVSSCLLASNNPACLTAVVAAVNYAPPTPSPKDWRQYWYRIQEKMTMRVFESQYVPAWMWNRGQTTAKWVQRCRTVRGRAVENATFWGMIKIWLIVMLLISVPTWLAFVVSYSTPMKGFGCRSSSIAVYFCSQAVLGFVTIGRRQACTQRLESVTKLQKTWWRCVEVLCYAMAFIATLFALFAGIGGTIMQLSGIFRNCRCLALSQFNPRNINGIIELATDTQAAREAAGRYWIGIGIAGESWLALTCAFAWWYQRHTKQQCLREIKRVGYARLEIRLPNRGTQYLQAGGLNHKLRAGDDEVSHVHYRITRRSSARVSQLRLYQDDLHTASYYAQLSTPRPELQNSQRITWAAISNTNNQGVGFEKNGSLLVVSDGANPPNTSSTFAFNVQTKEVVKLDTVAGLLNERDNHNTPIWLPCELHFCI